MINHKIMLNEVEEIGAWNNFKSICYVLDDIRDDIKKISNDIKEQQKQINIMAKGIEAIVTDSKEFQIIHPPNVELPRWLKHKVEVKK